MTMKEEEVEFEVSKSCTPVGVLVMEIFAVCTFLSVGSVMVNVVLSGPMGRPSCMKVAT